MKRFRFLSGLLLGLFCLAAVIPTAGLAAFSNSDLAGTWHVYTFADRAVSNDAFWDRGTVTINSSGVVTAGSLVDSDGGAASVTGGSLSLNSLGVMTGTLSLSDGTTVSVSHGKMDRGKTMATVVGFYNPGYRFKGSVFKAGGTFFTSEIAGTWHFHVFSDDPAVNDPVWSRGTITLNSAGTVTGGTVVDSNGVSSTVTGGFVSLNTAGVLTGSLTVAGAGTVTISEGKIDAGKTMGAFVGIDGTFFRLKGSLTKAGGAFATANLAGKWHFYSFWDRPFPNTSDPGWDRGTLVVNSSGGVIGGTLVDSDGFSGSVTGGLLSLDSNGVLSGFFTGGGVTYTISHGKLDAAKTVLSYVGTDNLGTPGFRFQGTAIKGDVQAVSDFDGDGKADIGIYRDGVWFIIRSSDGGITALGWGGAVQDIPVPKDYDGDGKADIAIYRSGVWFIIRSSDGGQTTVGWGGAAQDIPVPADYDGDGKADIAVYRSGVWFIIRSSDGGVTTVGWGGAPQDKPVPADYDGDGKVDIAVYRDGVWFIIRSSDGGQTTVGWGGAAQDIPVPKDYDGDGKADIAVYRSGVWFIIRSSDGGVTTVGWGGAPQDKPVPADYDGDGKVDIAVYRNGVWFIVRSSDGGVTTVGWGGAPQDIPLN